MSLAFVDIHAERVLSNSADSAAVQSGFFRSNAREIARCAQAMAQAFQADARLFAFGNGGGACIAQHVAVEFSHPIVEHRRALPAMALGAEPALLTAIGSKTDFAFSFARQLQLHGAPNDIALGISTSGRSSNILQALKAAQERSMLTVAFGGTEDDGIAEWCDFSFVVDSLHSHRVQETYATLVHVLWDLVHLALGEDALL